MLPRVQIKTQQQLDRTLDRCVLTCSSSYLIHELSGIGSVVIYMYLGDVFRTRALLVSRGGGGVHVCVFLGGPSENL